MLGLLFIPAATQRVAQIVLCGLMIGSPGGIDLTQNTQKFQVRQEFTMHLEIVTVVLSNDAIGYYC